MLAQLFARPARPASLSTLVAASSAAALAAIFWGLLTRSVRLAMMIFAGNIVMLWWMPAGPPRWLDRLSLAFLIGGTLTAFMLIIHKVPLM